MKKTKFSSKDLGMLAFLIVFLVGVLYYMGFYKPLQAELATLAAQSAEADDQINLAMSKASKMKVMQAELEEILARPKSEITEIAPYDNKEVVLNMLNGILSQSLEYSLSFTDPEVQGDGTVRRNIEMNFTCADYQAAKAIIKNLTKSNWRCLVRNCALSSERGYSYIDENGDEIRFVDTDEDDKSEDLMIYPVTVSATITFFESTKLSK